EIKRDYVSGNGPFSGSFTDSLGSPGSYFIGLHTADNAGNWSTEGSLGVIRLTVTAPNTTAQTETTSTGQMLSSVQLRDIMKDLSVADAQKFVGPINDSLHEFGITNPNSLAAILAQMAVETNELREWSEIGATGIYFGRGPLQLTTQGNYLAAGNALGYDLVSHPELVADTTRPQVGFRVAAWYWKQANGVDLSTLANQNSPAFREITRFITKGANAPLPDSDLAGINYSGRWAYYQRAWQVLLPNQPFTSLDAPPVGPTDPSGFVFVDANQNGLRDAGEFGVSSVPVRLSGLTGAGTQIDETTLTDATGFYDFFVDPGIYTLAIQRPANYLPGPLSLGSLGGTIVDWGFSQIVIGEGEVATNYDFALWNNPPTTPTQIATSTTLTTAGSAAYGKTTFLIATVNPTGGAVGLPAGTVVFRIGDTIVRRMNLLNGRAVLQIKLPEGWHAVSATYLGNRKYVTSDDALTVDVAASSTTVKLTPSPTILAVERKTTFAVVVTSDTGRIPGGTVTFKVAGPTGSMVLNPVKLVNGRAKSPVFVFPSNPGEYTVTAEYKASTANFTNSAAERTQMVSNFTKAAISSKSTATGAYLYSKITSTPGGGVPSGTVSFYEIINGIKKLLGSGTVNANGVASIFASLAPGLRTITVAYESDGAAFNPAKATLQVNGRMAGWFV
ncbi:MAG: Ig-like domain repeat protein, partial [Planctomycetes bacterium]|nr:Ig-like domain repeat protein [Planctomycetota bacterium]